MGLGENVRFGRKFWDRVNILGLGENYVLTRNSQVSIAVKKFSVAKMTQHFISPIQIYFISALRRVLLT